MTPQKLEAIFTLGLLGLDSKPFWVLCCQNFMRMFSIYQLVSTIIIGGYSCNVVRELLPLTSPTLCVLWASSQLPPIIIPADISSRLFAAWAYFGYHFLAIITFLVLFRSEYLHSGDIFLLIHHTLR